MPVALFAESKPVRHIVLEFSPIRSNNLFDAAVKLTSARICSRIARATCLASGWQSRLVFRNIELPFVKEQRFNQIRVALQNFAHLARNGAIARKIRRQDFGVRAQAFRGRLTCGLFCSGSAIVDTERYNWKRAFLGAKLYLAAYAQRLGTTGHFFRRRCDPFLLPHAEGKSGIFLVAVEIAPSATVSHGIVRLEIDAPCRYLAGGGCVQSVSIKTRQRGSSMARLRSGYARGLGPSQKAADGCGFRIVDIKYGHQLGDLQHFVELAAEIGESQRYALLLGADVPGDQGS